MGVNIGIIVIVMILVFGMDIVVKKVVLSYLLFNVGGVFLFLFFILLFGDKLSEIMFDFVVVLVNIYFIFNVVVSLVFIVFVNFFMCFVDFLFGEGKMDFECFELFIY